MTMRLFLLLLLLLAHSRLSYAILWDFTITGPASYSGGVGSETVTYRYDPDELTVISCTPTPANPCLVPDWWHYPVSDTWISGSRYTIGYGPIQSVTYHGLVEGASGPSEMNAFNDYGFGCTKNIGGTIFFEECDGLLSLKYPIAFVTPPILPVFWPSGGEDGFRWITGFECTGCPLADVLVSRSLAPVGLPEPGTVALLAACLAGIAFTQPRSYPKRLLSS